MVLSGRIESIVRGMNCRLFLIDCGKRIHIIDTEGSGPLGNKAFWPKANNCQYRPSDLQAQSVTYLTLIKKVSTQSCSIKYMSY